MKVDLRFVSTKIFNESELYWLTLMLKFTKDNLTTEEEPSVVTGDDAHTEDDEPEAGSEEGASARIIYDNSESEQGNKLGIGLCSNCYLFDRHIR